MHFLADYGLFLAKVITAVLAILLVLISALAIGSKSKERGKDKLVIKKINDKYKKLTNHLQEVVLNKQDYKQFHKQQKKQLKESEKQPISKKRLFIIRFNGDMRASQVNQLREVISALLQIATTSDEVVIHLDSPGGAVTGYGLAASQLKRIRDRHIPLVVAVDQVAASGGYMMACVGDRILAAPFAYIGSIGVVAQLPNFNKLLKKHHIDYEQITAGQYKRTLSIFGENTDEGRKKTKQDVEEIHYLFKNFIKDNRPQVDIETVATGEYWPAKQALELNLVDELITVDDYLINQLDTAELFEVSWQTKQSRFEKLSHAAQAMVSRWRVF